jgi:uncharacterized protein
MADQIRYDLLTQQALRGVVHKVLTDAAKKGLPGEHHFFISFDTHGDGVRVSDRLRAQYPEEMTIILQHQFWDLTVTEQGFEVGLSFGGVPEKLVVPFDAINGFFDPSVQFGLQFQEDAEGQDQRGVPANAQEKTSDTKKRATPPKRPVIVQAATPANPSAIAPVEPPSDKPTGGGEVVRLDRFRKK